MDKKKKDNEGFGLYLNHEGVKLGYSLGSGMVIDDEGLHFGNLKLW